MDKKHGEKPSPSNFHSSPRPPVASRIPPGSPDWVTSELIERTINLFQPKYDRELTADDALQMMMNVGHLFDMVEEE